MDCHHDWVKEEQSKAREMGLTEAERETGMGESSAAQLFLWKGHRESKERFEVGASVPQKVFLVLWAEWSQSELDPVRKGRN